MSGIPNGQIDVSPDELDRMRRRREIRQRLQAEFNRKYYNPLKAVYNTDLMDPAVQRLMAARTARYEHWKPSWKSFAVYFSCTFLPIIVYAKYLFYARGEKEKLYRAGLIPAKDRSAKWVWVNSNDLN
ncbi:hypothetical protein HDE_05946 [Halotydeus destructor]|nr:hypothetical protein HDE_05946 [Halotydeus destructor]